MIKNVRFFGGGGYFVSVFFFPLLLSLSAASTVAYAATDSSTTGNKTIIADIDNDSDVRTYSTGNDGNISFSMPTTVPCVMKADGTVISPSDWVIRNTCSKEIKLSGFDVTDLNHDLDIDMKLYEGSDDSGKKIAAVTSNGFNHASDVTIAANQSMSCRWWCDSISDYGRHNVWQKLHVATVSFTFKSNEPTQFAVYSDDDKSLKFYNRIDVPSVGDTFNGESVTAVYTGLGDYSYVTSEGHNGTPTTPWASYRKQIRYVDIVDRIKPSGISFWFQQCEAITDFRHLDNIDTSDLTRMDHVFFDCASLESIDCSSWNVNNVSYFDQVFGTCQKLRTVNINGWDTSKAGIFYYMFYFDDLLETVSGFDDLNLSSCHLFMHNFNNCRSIETMDFSRLHLPDGVVTDGTVYQCVNLRSIKVDSNFKWVYQGPNDENCPTISSPSSEYIKDVDDYGYWYDSSDGKGYLPTALPQNHAATYYAVKPCFAVYSSSDESLSFYKRFDEPQEGGAIDGKTATKVYDGIEYSDFEAINGAGNDYPLLPWLDVATNIKLVKVIDDGIHPKAVSNWCFGMSNAETIDLALLDTSRCTDFRSLFNGCSSITKLDLSNMDMSKMTDGRSMYYGCSRLMEITVNDTFRYDTTTHDSTAYYYLPTPDPKKYGQDGNWYKDEDGTAYAPQDVPNGGKGTYFCNRLMVPGVSFELCEFNTFSGNTNDGKQNNNSESSKPDPSEPDSSHDKPYPLKKKTDVYVRTHFWTGKGTISCKLFSLKQNATDVLYSFSNSFDFAGTMSTSYGTREFIFTLKGENDVPTEFQVGSIIYAEITLDDTELNQKITFCTNKVTITDGMTSAIFKSIRYSTSS